MTDYTYTVMRKVLVIMFTLPSIFCGFASELFARMPVKDHMITINILKDTYYVFNETIQVVITYKNNGKNDWKLRKPDKALSVEVYYGYLGDPENASPYTMGKIESIPGPEGSHTMAFVMPDPQYITIKAGEHYTLTSDIPWSGFLFPGKWVLWVQDITEDIKTETLKFQILFTKESVDMLLDIAKNTEESIGRRKWHTKFLREINTDMLDIKWPYWRESPEEKKQKEPLIQKKQKEFEEFWNKEKNSPDTEKAIKRINKVCREITESSSPKLCPDILEFRR